MSTIAVYALRSFNLGDLVEQFVREQIDATRLDGFDEFVHFRTPCTLLVHQQGYCFHPEPLDVRTDKPRTVEQRAAAFRAFARGLGQLVRLFDVRILARGDAFHLK